MRLSPKNVLLHIEFETSHIKIENYIHGDGEREVVVIEQSSFVLLAFSVQTKNQQVKINVYRAVDDL